MVASRLRRRVCRTLLLLQRALCASGRAVTAGSGCHVPLQVHRYLVVLDVFLCMKGWPRRCSSPSRYCRPGLVSERELCWSSRGGSISSSGSSSRKAASAAEQTILLFCTHQFPSHTINAPIPSPFHSPRPHRSSPSHSSLPHSAPIWPLKPLKPVAGLQPVANYATGFNSTTASARRPRGETSELGQICPRSNAPRAAAGFTGPSFGTPPRL
jgi:hypothetical protein